MQQILRTATLPDFKDGLAAQVIDDALTQVYQDIVDRPRLYKKRKVTVTFEFAPLEDDPNEVDIDITTKVSVPAQALSRRVKRVTRARGFGFESDTDSNDHDPAQRRLPLDDE